MAEQAKAPRSSWGEGWQHQPTRQRADFCQVSQPESVWRTDAGGKAHDRSRRDWCSLRRAGGLAPHPWADGAPARASAPSPSRAGNAGGKRGEGASRAPSPAPLVQRPSVAVKGVTANQGTGPRGWRGQLAPPETQSGARRVATTRVSPPSLATRVYPPSHGKKRPLGISTRPARAMQALALLGLDSLAETMADPPSYGLRPGRSTADASGQRLPQAAQAPRACLEPRGRLKTCFDRISHAWWLTPVPLDKARLHTPGCRRAPWNGTSSTLPTVGPRRAAPCRPALRSSPSMASNAVYSRRIPSPGEAATRRAIWSARRMTASSRATHWRFGSRGRPLVAQCYGHAAWHSPQSRPTARIVRTALPCSATRDAHRGDSCASPRHNSTCRRS